MGGHAYRCFVRYNPDGKGGKQGSTQRPRRACSPSGGTAPAPSAAAGALASHSTSAQNVNVSLGWYHRRGKRGRSWGPMLQTIQSPGRLPAPLRIQRLFLVQCWTLGVESSASQTNAQRPTLNVQPRTRTGDGQTLPHQLLSRSMLEVGG